MGKYIPVDELTSPGQLEKRHDENARRAKGKRDKKAKKAIELKAKDNHDSGDSAPSNPVLGDALPQIPACDHRPRKDDRHRRWWVVLPCIRVIDGEFIKRVNSITTCASIDYIPGDNGSNTKSQWRLNVY